MGADLAVMERDALRMRDGGPFVFAQVCLNVLRQLLFVMHVSSCSFMPVLVHSREQKVNKEHDNLYNIILCQL